jgi:MFS family permease
MVDAQHTQHTHHPRATPDPDDRVRTRLVWTLFGANALSSTAFIGAVTVASLLAEDLTGSAALAGLPSTAATVGTAGGALLLGSLGARHGRRPTFAGGFLASSIGAAAAVVAVLAGSFVAFIAALFVLGFGRSASQLARYAAGDLRTERRRGRAISLVVWASTFGAVLGPLLIAPAGRAVAVRGLQEDLGPIVLAAVGFAGAFLVVALALRPEPLTLAVREPADVTLPDASGLGALLRTPSVALSMTVLVLSQLVMVLVMTMTPLHLRGSGEGLDTVGWVMMAHTLGMFALAPVTGWVVDRAGARRVMAGGGVLLAAACVLASTASGSDTVVLLVSLFGLGYGWNLGFVAASTHLQHGLAVGDRARIQGVADAATWLAGGIGAAASGVVVATGSYALLGLAGAVLALGILLALAAGRTPVAAGA